MEVVFLPVSVVWLAVWLVGLLVCWLDGWLVGWLVGLLVCWLVGWLLYWYVGWFASMITQKQLNTFPLNLDGEWVSAQNRTH